MTDTNPTENQTPPAGAPKGDIAAELHALGNNLMEMLRSAWDNDERRRIQKEIEIGLNDLSATFKKAADDFAESPAGKNIKAETEDFSRRLRSGEVETQVRKDVVDALRTINEQLQKAGLKKSPPPTGGGENQPPQAG